MMHQHLKTEKYFLLLLCISAFVLRALLFVFHIGTDDYYRLAFDSEQYEKIAVQIAQGHGISTQEGVANFYRLPGYPIFLAACYKLFGFSSKNALWVQIVLASFIPLLIFFLSLSLFPGNLLLAKIAASSAVVHVGFMVYAGILASESLFLFFFLLFCIFFFKPRFGVLSLCCAGIFLGVASLFRAVGHYLIVLSLLLLLLSHDSLRQKIKAQCILFMSWLSVVIWWLARNWVLTGFIFFHTLPGLHFLQYAAVNAEMGYVCGDETYFKTKKKLFKEWDSEIEKKELHEERQLNEYERHALAEKLALKYLLKNPLATIKNAIINIARTCCTLYSTLLLYVPLGTVYANDASLWFKIKLYLFPRALNPWLTPLIYWELLFSLLMLIGFLIFLLRMLSDRNFLQVGLRCLPFIALLLGITFAYGCARLRFPCEQFFIIFATAGWLAWWQRKVKHDKA